MNKENVQWLVIGLLVAGLIGLGIVIVNQKSRLAMVEGNLNAARQTIQSSYPMQETESMPVQNAPLQPTSASQKMAKSICPRAHVKEENQLNANGSVKETFYTVSVNGQSITASTIGSSEGRIHSAIVSSDCSRVSWIIVPQGETDGEGNFLKSQSVQTVRIGENQIRTFQLPEKGPAFLDDYLQDRIVVGIGKPFYSEADIPQESESDRTFYAIEMGNGSIYKVGGPYISVSPDLKKMVKKTDTSTISLLNTVTNKTIVLAKGEKEYATDFTFSPDSANLAYLKLSGEREVIMATLYRPIALDENQNVTGAIVIQSVNGETTKDVIRGGFGPDNEFRVNRWISSTILQYTQPEASVRVHQVDYSTVPPTVEKKELVDWDAI